jgi:hypothetical protein
MKYSHRKGITDNRDWFVIVLIYLVVILLCTTTYFAIAAYVYEAQRNPCRNELITE